jgi:mannosyltransferase
MTVALGAVIAVGALLRFATLGVQRPWVDEAVTAGLLRLDLGGMLSAVSTTESTPPLYYLLARAWAVVFGTGAVGLRSLSALLGTLTIPVAYAIGATLVSRRAGLFAAALTAVSPPLVWYSQEARSYALLILLCALSLLFLAHALRGGTERDVILWALAAVLALLTHYFAAFLVAGEAVWLLAAFPDRRRAAWGVAAVALCGVALLPLAIDQSHQGNLDFIGDTSLGSRVVETAKLFLAGPTGARLGVLVGVLAAAAVLAAALALRATDRERRAALGLAALALSGAAVPVVLSLLGSDYLLARNLLPVWLPLTVAIAIGLAAERSGRLGPAALAVLVAGSLWLVGAVAFDRGFQREVITAQLTGSRLDGRRERIDPVVGYAVGDAGETLRAGADCEPGYSVASGGAVLRHGGEGYTLPARGSERAQHAEERAPADDAVLAVYAVCSRPLD